jgi:dienelactone hydrolase
MFVGGSGQCRERTVKTLTHVSLVGLVWVAIARLGPFHYGACAQEAGQAAGIELLPPSGALSLGRSSFHWVGAARNNAAAEPGATREVMVHVWYPAEPRSDSSAAPYIPGFTTIQAAIGEAHLREEAGAAYDALASARTHVVDDAPLSSHSRRYPVLLVSHGLRYHSLGYSMLSEDLASHGYVVVGVDHPSTAFAVLFPDERVTRFSEPLWSQRRTAEETQAFERKHVELCAADLMFVVNQLERLDSGAIPSRLNGRLDLARIGVIGHSFGGRNAARACQLDKRLKAGVILDGFGRRMTVDKNPDGSTIEQPMMLQYARRVPRGGIARVMALLQNGGKDLEDELRPVRKEFCESVKGGSYEVVLSIPGMVHESFSDMPLLESGLSEVIRKDRQRAMETIRSYTRAFFDRHVRSVEAPLLDEPALNASEVELTHYTFRSQP